MAIENEQTHYRTRFVLCPYSTTKPAIVEAFRGIYRWVYEKEQKREESALFTSLRGPEMQSRFLSGKFNHPDGYTGGINLDPEVRLCTDALIGKRAGIPDAWAMEYDEPDQRCQFRHWHTRVGLSTSRDGTCIVNISVTYYTLPTYIGKKLRDPLSNVPRLARSIFTLADYQCTVGETVVQNGAIMLDEESFDREFRENLLSADRDLPLILVVSDQDGRYSIGDVQGFAAQLLGMANVYALDYRNAGARSALFRLFLKDTPAYRYNCTRGTIRLYWPSIDLEDGAASSHHRFFTWADVSEYSSASSFVEMLNRSLGKSYVRGDLDVVDLGDIARLKNRRKLAEGEERIAELRGKLEKAAAEREKRARGVDFSYTREQFDKLKDELRSAENDLELWKKYEEAVSEQNSTLMQENKSLRERFAELEGSVQEANGYKHRLDEANDRAEKWRREAKALRDSLESLRELPGFVHDVRDELELAERLWGSRLVVLDEAYRSAKNFRAFDLEEEWLIISAVANELWEIYFAFDGGTRIEDAFYLKTGIVLATTESSSTRADPSMMRLRDRQYMGKTIRCEPHVKGNGKGGAGDKFRLHFYADRENRKIVIGHCGEHLKTSGTMRM